MTLDPRIARLVAVGASVAANCQPCLEKNVAAAAHEGATPQELSDAIAIGRMVREGAARKLDRAASNLGVAADPPSARTGGCERGS